MNAKTREIAVRFNCGPGCDIEVKVPAQTPPMALSMAIRMYAPFAALITHVQDVDGTLRRVHGRCSDRNCQSWIIEHETCRPVDGPNGKECGECRPGQRLNLERTKRR